MDSHAKALELLGLPVDGLAGSPPILADYVVSDVGRDMRRAEALIAALGEADAAAQFYGNLYVLEPEADGVRIRHLYDEARLATLPKAEVITWLTRWQALLDTLPQS